MNLSGLMRVAIRGTHFIFHLAKGVLLASVCRLRHGRHWHQTEHGQALITAWIRQLARLLGLRISGYGRPIASQALFVSNHISFLDIIVIAGHVPARFLAKHSIRYWPVIGYLTALSGSLFIRRGKQRQLGYTLTTIRDALDENRPVLIFPEGTTSLGNEVLKFHSGLFQAAIDARVPVQPITLHYRHAQQPDRLAAYIEQDNFLFSLLRLMARPAIEVHLSFTTPVESTGHTRRSLAAFCQARISQNLVYQLQCRSDITAKTADSKAGVLGGYESGI
jgi:1-acyl-sn-glycerol-3-phosphate acyltransferase